MVSLLPDELVEVFQKLQTFRDLQSLEFREWGKRMGYFSRRPRQVPLVSARNRNLRLQWAQVHQNRTGEDWER